jgi:hypothetical protein
MTTSAHQPIAHSESGYVLRGGPLNGAVVRDQCPAFVHIEHHNGIGDVYTPSGMRDIEHTDLERYDFEEAMSDHGRPHTDTKLFGYA